MFQERLLNGKRILIAGGGFAGLDQLSDADWGHMRALITARNDKDRSGRSA